MGLEHVIGLGLFIYFQKGHSGPSRGLLTWRLFRNFRPLNINHWGQDSKPSIHLYGLFKIGIPRTYSDNTQYIGSPYQFTCVSSVNWGNWAVPCFWECKTYKTGLWIPQKKLQSSAHGSETSAWLVWDWHGDFCYLLTSFTVSFLAVMLFVLF